jgi:predicted AlkP superfamily phosphohydrolase/phosphomutase
MNQTVLIGLDGAAFSILDPLMEDGTMPFLKEFTSAGVRAELLSTTNPLTPPAWISMITGRSPGNHGVFDFIWAEERNGEVYFTLYNFRDIACETIWSIVNRQNGTVCSLNFPMMSPPPAVSGVIVPGLVSWKHLRRNVYPRELYGKLKELPGFNVKELAWDFELEKKAEKGVPHEEYENWIRFHIQREKHWFEIMRYIMKNDPCNLTAIIFDGVDKILHIGLKYLHRETQPENPSPWEQQIRDLCLDYFRMVDGFLSEIVQLAGPDARFFITSDHGFGPSWEVFRVNSWLHSQGYLKWKDTDRLDEKDKKSVERLIDRHFVYLDWDNTTAYARTTTSNGIYIRVAKGAHSSGIPAERYEEFRDELIRNLETVRDESTGERIIKRILTKEEAYPGSNNNNAPDLTLIMRDHSFASIVKKMPVVVKRPDVEGTHYPEGIFIAKGPGIQEGVTLSQIKMVDVAPSLLYSLGLPVPEDFEGHMPKEMFSATFLEKNPYMTGEPTQSPGFDVPETGETVIGSEERKMILEKLKTLGYIE